MVDIVINVRRNVSMKRLAVVLSSVPDELKEKILAIFREEGMAIRDDAKANAPVKTGRMRDLIILRDTPTGVEIVGCAPYTGYQELGTRYIEPRLFITKAFNAHERILGWKIQQAIIDSFREVT